MHEEEEEEEGDTGEMTMEEKFRFLFPMRASGKIRSIVLSRTADRALLALNNNAIELYTLIREGGAARSSSETGSGQHFALATAIAQQGHRADIRAIALTSNDQTLITVSSGSTKIWSMSSGACIHTIECGYGLCTAVVPGGKYAIVGTKEGTL
jgi:U3 small nucleolar RNA-associated protein 12